MFNGSIYYFLYYADTALLLGRAKIPWNNTNHDDYDMIKIELNTYC